jgi:hypothetical protein
LSGCVCGVDLESSWASFRRKFVSNAGYYLILIMIRFEVENEKKSV